MKAIILIIILAVALPCFGQQTVYRDRYGNTVETRERQGNDYTYRDRYGNAIGTERYEGGRRVYRDQYGNVEYAEER